MPAAKPSVLTRMARRLIGQAAQSPGAVQREILRGGAVLAVVRRGGAFTLTISRLGTPLGDRELPVFHAHLPIPATAVRDPAALAEQHQRTDADQQVRWYVVYRWSEEGLHER